MSPKRIPKEERERREKFSIYDALPKNVGDPLWEVATRIGRQFNQEPDDLVGVAWVWIGEHPAQGNASWFYDSKSEPGKRNFSYRLFRRDITRVMVDYCRREVVKLQGDREKDQLSYSRRQIETYLPYRWHSEVLAETGPDRPQVSTSNDPAYGGNTQACVLDINRAYQAIITDGSDWDQTLFLRFGLGYTVTEISQEFGEAVSTTSQRITQALEALARELNGSGSFGLTLVTPEIAFRGYPGARKSLSNSQAMAATAKMVEG